jgi:hypothetical protein
MRLLAANKNLLADDCYWIHAMDTEYVLHLAACLEMQKEPKRLPRKSKKKKPPKKNKRTPALVALRECPSIDAELEGRLVELVLRSVFQKGKTVSRRLQKLQGTIVKVYKDEEESLVLKEMRVQDSHRHAVALRDWEAEEEEEEELEVEAAAGAIDSRVQGAGATATYDATADAAHTSAEEPRRCFCSFFFAPLPPQVGPIPAPSGSVNRIRHLRFDAGGPSCTEAAAGSGD